MATPVKRGKKYRIQPHKTLPDGTYVRTSITADTKAECKRLADAWINEVDLKYSGKTITVGEALDAYIETCRAQKLSSSSIVSYVSRRNNSYVGIIDKRINSLTIRDIQDLVNKRSEKGISPKTLRIDLILLRQALLPYNVNIDTSKIKLAKTNIKPKMEFRESWQFDVPAKMAELYGKNDHYLYLLFIIYAGLRPSESFALVWGDISKDPIIIYVDGKMIKLGTIDISKACVIAESGDYEIKKTKSEAGNRIVKVPWTFIEELTAVKSRGKDTDRIFDVKPNSSGIQWQAVKKALGMPSDMRRDDMRHYYATTKVMAGATEEELQTDMGHTTSTFTHKVYVEMISEHKDSVNVNFTLLSQQALEKLRSIRQDPDPQESKKDEA